MRSASRMAATADRVFMVLFIVSITVQSV